MIHKVSEQWNKIEGDAKQVEKPETEELERVLGQIRSVSKVLKRMCEVSVTRTSLKNAVREALLPIIREHRDELFPEIAEINELKRRLAIAESEAAASAAAQPALPPEFRERLESFESRIAKIAELETRIQGDFTQLGERIDKEGESRRRDLAELKESLGQELQSGALSVEEKIGKVQEYLRQLETSIPQAAEKAAGEVETRLRREIEAMVEELGGKLSEVEEILRRIEEFVPRKEALEAVDRRLASLESTFERVAGQVESIESATPEVRSLGDRFADLRRQISDVTDRLSVTTEGVTSSRDALAARLDELQHVLRDGIDRWESDQSTMHERLSSLRDTLRDQLQGMGQQVAGAQASFWGKITGKKEPGLKLSAQDFDDLSSKLEGIIGGLEAIIARKKGGR
ncbi:MAG: hypothetical protein JXA90_13990 [Planctomycetes bacterium]|nr:hypothetical protein [Planctomycetota bacterium]